MIKNKLQKNQHALIIWFPEVNPDLIYWIIAIEKISGYEELRRQWKVNTYVEIRLDEFKIRQDALGKTSSHFASNS